MNLNLFPKNEEWGTGDEALDLKLSQALKRTSQNLSIEVVSEFYFLATSLKPRTYNPTFNLTIELVTKALLFHLAPEDYNDFQYKKLKGHYFLKERINFNFEESEKILNELKLKNKFRYLDQIDFYLSAQKESERNPFIESELRKSPYDLQAKIIFKEFKNFLSGQDTKETYSNPFFDELRDGKRVLVIDNFTEIWYDVDQIFSLPIF